MILKFVFHLTAIRILLLLRCSFKRYREKLLQEPHMGVRMVTELPDKARRTFRRVDKIRKELIDRIMVNGRATQDFLDNWVAACSPICSADTPFSPRTFAPKIVSSVPDHTMIPVPADTEDVGSTFTNDWRLCFKCSFHSGMFHPGADVFREIRDVDDAMYLGE